MVAILNRLGAHWYWHSQNLNGEWYPKSGSMGPMWRHGRAWLAQRGADDEGGRCDFGVEWSIFRRNPWSLGIKVGLAEGDGGDEAKVNVYVPGCALYFSARTPLTANMSARLCPRPEKGWYRRERELSFGLSTHAASWKLWADPWGEDQVSRWRSRYINLPGLLLGRFCHADRDIDTIETVVPMPEKAYPATARFFETTHWRARAPFAKRRVLRCEIEVPEGIPVEGKCESGWDCGEDRTYAMTCPANSIEQGIAALVESALRDRRRFGVPASLGGA